MKTLQHIPLELECGLSGPSQQPRGHLMAPTAPAKQSQAPETRLRSAGAQEAKAAWRELSSLDTKA